MSKWDEILVALSDPPEKLFKRKNSKGLIRYLKYGDDLPSVQEDAARYLGELREKAAVDALIAALRNSGKSEVRKNAASSLGKIRDDRGIESLIGALKDTDYGVRVRAAEALENIGNTTAVTALGQALGYESSNFVRLALAKSIISFFNKGVAVEETVSNMAKTVILEEDERHRKRIQELDEEKRNKERKEEEDRKKKRCQSCGVVLINPLDFAASLEGRMVALRGPGPGLDLLRGKSDTVSAGLVCRSCKATFCMPCLSDKGKTHVSGEGIGCLNCGGRMEMMY